jgi:hypothetical protein
VKAVVRGVDYPKKVMNNNEAASSHCISYEKIIMNKIRQLYYHKQ